MTHWLRKILSWVFTPIVALLLIFEEWGWVPLSRLLKYIVQLPLWAGMWARLGSAISRLPPWAALVVLAVPSALLFPIKLIAFYLMGHGQHAVGITLLAAAKILGTALVARLFDLTQPSLMQLAWFAKWYPRWKTWKDSIMQRVRASAVWTAGRRIKDSAARGVAKIKGALSQKPR